MVIAGNETIESFWAMIRLELKRRTATIKMNCFFILEDLIVDKKIPLTKKYFTQGMSENSRYE
jgi:hypothetical protein